MDDLDRRILDAVQEDAGRTIGELAEIVGSTPATCHRRYRALRRNGPIRKVVALTDPADSRQPITVLIGISLRDQSSSTQNEMRRFMRDLVEVRIAWMTTGEFDYVLVGGFADMAGYLRFLESRIEPHPKIVGYRSFVSMDEVKFDPARAFSQEPFKPEKGGGRDRL